MSGGHESSDAVSHENGRDERIEYLVRRWQTDALQMPGAEAEELERAVEDGLVTQEELMRESDAA